MVRLSGNLTFLEFPKGRKLAIRSRYSPNFIVKGARYSGVINLLNHEVLLPGQSALAEVEIPNELVCPEDIAINEAIQFWEGAKLVGIFVIYKIIT